MSMADMESQKLNEMWAHEGIEEFENLAGPAKIEDLSLADAQQRIVQQTKLIGTLSAKMRDSKIANSTYLHRFYMF